MRSIAADQRTSVANFMPGRYKSCRRSTGELFSSKSNEQDWQQYAQSEVLMKKEQEQEEEQSVKMDAVTPPRFTPLRWRSTSMKELHGNAGLEVPSARPVEESSKTGNCLDPVQQTEEVRCMQSAKRPSQAQLREQVMNSLLVDQGNSSHQASRVASGQLMEALKAPNAKESSPTNGAVISAKPLEQVNSERNDHALDQSTVNPEKPEECVHFPKKQEDVPKTLLSGGDVEKSGPPVPVILEPMEDINFQPVDLDQKYREKELVRHVTAAKIQNREEAILNNPGSPGLNNRRVPVGEEPAAMTIEFLRARLQAERSASKATKLRMEQLSKKVLELEGRLVAEVELRKSAESALQDALLKLKQAAVEGDQGIQQVACSPVSGLQKVSSVGEVEGSEKKTLPRIDEKKDVELIRPKSVSFGDKLPEINSTEKEDTGQIGVSKEDTPNVHEDKESASAAVESSDSTVVIQGGLWTNRSVSLQPSGQDSRQTINRGKQGSEVLPEQDTNAGSSPERAPIPSQQKQEMRAAIEERLRSMWASIAKDMAALAEVKSKDQLDEKVVTGWMGQLPNDIQGKQSGDGAADSHHEVHLNAPSQRTEEAHGNQSIQHGQISDTATAIPEKRGSFKRNSSLAKNVAKLVEQYEFQETAQRQWEENFEAQQSLGKKEDELPALVTRDGDVLTEGKSGASADVPKGGQGEGNIRVHSLPISRSKSMGLLPSQQEAATGYVSRERSSNERGILVEKTLMSGDEELVYDPETEVAEELPNGIYLHHSRDDVDPHRRVVKDTIYPLTTERVDVSDGLNSPCRSERTPRSRERSCRTSTGLRVEVDPQGWPVREVQDKASRDMYYDPVMNNRSVRVDAPYNGADREFLLRAKTNAERMPEETMYGNGTRWEALGVDPNWDGRQEERRVPAPHFSYPSSEESRGIPYGYRDRDRWEQDVQYRNNYRHREDVHRGVPAWQEGGDPGMRNRGMNQKSYVYPPSYSMEGPQQSQFAPSIQLGETAGYSSRRGMQHVPHGPRSDFHPVTGMPGPRPSSNGYEYPDQPNASRCQPGQKGMAPLEERNVAAEVSDDGPGEASEVLKALRIAKQQIKSSTGEQAAYMTAQYTVSQEHRYGAGGQVSKTSYTVEAPVGYPRVTKTVHEGWHLEGAKASKKRGGYVGSNGVAIDLTGANVTELLTGAAGPLNVSGESSYVEKLNVGRGIQFFFSG